MAWKRRSPRAPPWRRISSRTDTGPRGRRRARVGALSPELRPALRFPLAAGPGLPRTTRSDERSLAVLAAGADVSRNSGAAGAGRLRWDVPIVPLRTRAGPPERGPAGLPEPDRAGGLPDAERAGGFPAPRPRDWSPPERRFITPPSKETRRGHKKKSWEAHNTPPSLSKKSGGDLLSQGAPPQVPSARAVFTSVFGMGTGVTPPL